MALSADTPRKVLGGHWVDYPMLASATIYEGSLVGLSSGYARALTALDTFVGIAQKGCVETTAANGGETCRVRAGVWREEFTLASVAITDVGKPVYATDDGTLSLTPGAYSAVGKVIRYISSNLAEVEFHTCDPNALYVDADGDVTLISADDVAIYCGKTAADTLTLGAYDIAESTYPASIILTSHATAPTLALAAQGAMTLTGSGTGGDITITAGNDVAVKAGTTAADVVTLNGYDTDATAYKAMLTVASHATAPSLNLGVAGGTVGFWGVAGATQKAHITQADTTTTGVSAAIAAILVVLEDYGLTASA